MNAAHSERAAKYKQCLRDPLGVLALGFGVGLSPWAPGTFGTLLAIPLYLGLMVSGPAVYATAVVAFFLLGVVACGRCGAALGRADDPAIVWDEIVGFLIALWGAPVSVVTVALGFVLFRFFDILKPWPIRAIDRRTSGGLGVMFDDVLAGLFVAAILHGIRMARPGFPLCINS
jgi:phosphatidylglycerophosphatase A